MYRKRMKRSLFIACLSFVLLATLALAEKRHYLTPGQVDLSALLPSPPGGDSAQTKAELAELLSLQAARTPGQEAQAQADQHISVFRFADVLGPAFAKESLPQTTAFFENIRTDESGAVSVAKKHWERPRPYSLEQQLRPCVSKPSNASYPSGHSTWGHLAGLVLERMVPEKADALRARAALYARQRLIGGVHYPSDVAAGARAAAIIADALFSQESFRRDFEAARVELRGALGLP